MESVFPSLAPFSSHHTQDTSPVSLQLRSALCLTAQTSQISHFPSLRILLQSFLQYAPPIVHSPSKHAFSLPLKNASFYSTRTKKTSPLSFHKHTHSLFSPPRRHEHLLFTSTRDSLIHRHLYHVSAPFPSLSHWTQTPLRSSTPLQNHPHTSTQAHTDHPPLPFSSTSPSSLLGQSITIRHA